MTVLEKILGSSKKFRSFDTDIYYGLAITYENFMFTSYSARQDKVDYPRTIVSKTNEKAKLNIWFFG